MAPDTSPTTSPCAYVIQDGDINITLWRVFGRKYLSFTGLVSSMNEHSSS